MDHLHFSISFHSRPCPRSCSWTGWFIVMTSLTRRFTRNDDEEEEFDDWIDTFYGFSHFIDPTLLSLYSPTPDVALSASEETNATPSPPSSPTPSTEPATISPPRNSATIRQDDRLLAVHRCYCSGPESTIKCCYGCIP
jgi:hypothetical protein